LIDTSDANSLLAFLIGTHSLATPKLELQEKNPPEVASELPIDPLSECEQ